MSTATVSDPMLIPGYDDLTLIGRGGFAHVYRARQRSFDRDVAVKVLLVSLDDERDRRRFARECSAMGRLTGHPHIVTVLESGVTPEGNPYLTTPFYECGTLAGRLTSDGPFPVDAVLATGVALAGALEVAHANGILHRDVKPANVLLSTDGDPAQADFGNAVIAAEAGELSQVTHAFTITHAPPEILEGRRATEATDVYSLASTLWTMLTGAPPFGHDDGQGLAARVHRVQYEEVPPFARTDVPASLEAALRDALAKRPDDRPPSARALGERLQAVQRERGDAVTPLRAGSAAAPLTVALPGTPAAPVAPDPTGTVAWPHEEIRWADDQRVAPANDPEPEPVPAPPVAARAPAPVPAPARRSIQIDPPVVPAPTPPPLPSPGPTAAGDWSEPSDPPPRSRAVLVTAAVVVVVLGVVAGALVALTRSGDDPIATPPPSTTEPAPTTTAPPVETTAPPTTAAPTTTAAPPPPTAPVGPASVIVHPDAPKDVKDAATSAQGAANALAAGDWADARRRIPSLAGSSDAALAEAWAGLEQSTLVVTDWKERGPTTELRLGQVALEQVADGDRTSLYCVTWTVRGDTVVSMAGQQVVAAPWQPGAADPKAAASVLTDACRDLDSRGGDDD